jgi:DNA modification methylase
MRSLIEFFTKSGETVLDYFMGVGGSLIGASLCGRNAVEIDINPLYVETYKEANAELGLKEQAAVVGDCATLLNDKTEMSRLLGGKYAGMILIDPPYANMMSKKKTGADIKVYGEKATPFSDSPLDLGNMPYGKFLTTFTDIVRQSLIYLKKKGYLVIFCKDMQPKLKTTNLLHAAIIEALNGIDGLYYRGLKIWADQSSKLFPYGYPFDFVANQIHQYILIFRKY